MEKARTSGPAAWVMVPDPAHAGAQARLLEVLRRQHVEVHRLSSASAVENPARKNEAGKETHPHGGRQRFPAGSYVIRMDQPYSRIADALLDRQYWSPKDRKFDTPYDDTGWSLGDLFNLRIVRVTDPGLLAAPMQRAPDPVVPAGLASIDLPPAAALPRIALMHTWLSTQTEGWWRMELDAMKIPYSYISTQDITADADLRKRYDVILFAPTGQPSTRQIIDGMPMWGNPLPWKTTELTPNLGKIDSTDDIRPGMGDTGLANLKKFVAEGGLLITSEDTARFAIETGMAPGVYLTPTEKLRIVGSVLRAHFVDPAHPIASGYGSNPLPVYSSAGMSFYVADVATPNGRIRGSRWGGPQSAREFERPTGRGDKQDVDVPEGRAFMDAHPLPDNRPWEPMPLNEEQRRNNAWAIPDSHRPQVVLRFSEADDLLVSGLLDGSSEIAERAAVVNARYGQGSVLLFAINPIWRGSTVGSYRMVFNAILRRETLAAH